MTKTLILLILILVVILFSIFVVAVLAQRDQLKELMKEAIVEQELGCYCITQCLDETILLDVQENMTKLKNAFQL